MVSNTHHKDSLPYIENLQWLKGTKSVHISAVYCFQLCIHSLNYKHIVVSRRIHSLTDPLTSIVHLYTMLFKRVNCIIMTIMAAFALRIRKLGANVNVQLVDQLR